MVPSTDPTVRLILAYESLCLSVPVPLLVHVHTLVRQGVVVVGDDGIISAAPMPLPGSPPPFFDTVG